MRDLDEQLRMIQSRSLRLRQEKRRRRTILRETGLVCACMVLIAGAALWVSGVTGAAVPVTASPYGSMIAGSRFIGYIVIGVLAFLLVDGLYPVVFLAVYMQVLNASVHSKLVKP